jgi:transposase
MKKRPQESKQRKKKKKVSIDQGLQLVNPNAAGIDLGAKEHWVAVGADRAAEPVRRFGTFTDDLEALARWLKECRVTRVAMEATGVYWVPVFQVLERHGFEVLLVNARQIKNVSGRKSDVADCQWIQRLHSYGLLGGSFRPADAYCVARSYLRYRDELVAARSTQTQHMQKALLQMNLQLKQVLSDTSGLSGLAIIEAIVKGERDPAKLAGLAHRRVQSSQSQIMKALAGDYRAEHLFVLQSALELYQTYDAKITRCDEQLARQLEALPDRVDSQAKPLPPKAANKKIDEELRSGLYRKFGVDLTAVEGIGPQVALTVLTEVGPDLSRFKTEKHFTSWLGLCPDNRISGGKVLSCRTRRVVNRLSDVLRLAATALAFSESALGAFHRRMKAKLGAAEGVTATAHKLARLIYRLVKHGEAYVKQGMDEYEKKYRERRIKYLKKIAAANGFQLVRMQALPTVVS